MILRAAIWGTCLVLVTGCVDYGNFFNPIIGEIRRETRGLAWGSRTEISTAGLNEELNVQQFQALMSKHGFEENELDDGWSQSQFGDDAGAGAVIFEKSGSDGVCNLGYFIIARFNGHGILISTKGTKYQLGCL